jgi:hypothetical protein
MFHDVLLLGKGGRTVYLGESSRALEYRLFSPLLSSSSSLPLVHFSSCFLLFFNIQRYFEMLGFVCPPLVNPPDFFLDVISGEVERQGHPEFVPQDLFDLWEQNRNKYPKRGRGVKGFLYFIHFLFFFKYFIYFIYFLYIIFYICFFVWF